MNQEVEFVKGGKFFKERDSYIEIEDLQVEAKNRQGIQYGLRISPGGRSPGWPAEMGSGKSEDGLFRLTRF